MNRPVIKLEHCRDLLVDNSSSVGLQAHISAASGLVRIGRSYSVVVDDELHIGVFPVHEKTPGKLVRIFAGELPASKADRKKAKPDLESIAVLEDELSGEHRLLLLPSGSKPNRANGAIAAIAENHSFDKIQAVDFSALYHRLSDEVPDLNIEGACVQKGILKLFQRGNSERGMNQTIDLDLRKVISSILIDGSMDPEAVISVKDYDLGELNGVRLSFTDAASVGKSQIWFVAAAEATENTYDDAECEGSVIGLIESEKICGVWQLDSKVKFEGIHVEQTLGGIDFFVVTDADDDRQAAQMFRGQILSN